ncbi:GGDEF domain-containing protein [Maioricimonas rarisocia]|uniref:GGDEF domain-containing protein n=1 Tax=Maioricimonas rarisocia TaxID=2528026 RepID=UPI0018D200ED|nr:GGDEF domain-containing protein [Maioricimonas rarisocia]
MHQDTCLKAIRPEIGTHPYILATDDRGRVVGIVPSYRILERLDADNDRERTRWEGMPLQALISTKLRGGGQHAGSALDSQLDCVVIAEGETVVGISTDEDVFLSWRRLESMLSAAVSDPLTGLMNRLAYDRRLSEEWARSRRTGTSVGVVLIDLDKFKPINDSFGHHAGDDVLRGLAAVLETGLRSYDVVARYGGDEFVALCLDCRAGEIDVPIRRIQQGLARQRFEFGGTRVSVSVSVGAAVRHDGFEDNDPRELFAAADDCLYRAKRSSADAYVIEFGADSDATVRYVDTGFEDSQIGAAFVR